MSAHVRTPRGPLGYELIDISEPWRPPRPPVVCVHGIGMAPAVWHPLVRRLGSRRRAVLVHLHGHDASSRCLPTSTTTVADFADDVEAVLDALRIDAAHLVGESLGGTIALALAARGRARSLVTLSTAFDGSSVRSLDAWDTALAEEGIARWSREMIAGRFAPGAVSPAVRDWVDRVQRRVRPRAILGDRDALVRSDLTGSLPGIDVPTLVVGGAESPFLGGQTHLALAAAIRGAAVMSLSARHGVVLSHAGAWVPAAARLIARADRG